MTALHADLGHVASLLGTWSGRGRGAYPTIEPFEYAETVTFGHVGKPFLVYQQRTRSIEPPGVASQPMHAETGYWRFPAPGRVEVVLSHPTGVVEVEEGTIELALDGTITIELRTVAVSRTSTAKRVDGLERVVTVGPDTIEYRVRMAAVGMPMQDHLEALLHREPAD